MTYQSNTRRGFTQKTKLFSVPFAGKVRRQAGKGVIHAVPSFNNPPSALRAISSVREEGNNGFTLIELLVVVLIIGVLAAVALPQYQKAVEKSRAIEALSMINSLQKAVDVAVLAGDFDSTKDIEFFATAEEAAQHGAQPATLDIDFPWDDSQETKFFQYSVMALNGGTNKTILAIRLEKENNVPIYVIDSSNGGAGWTTTCLYHYAHTSGRGKNLCESLGGMGISTEENNLQ